MTGPRLWLWSLALGPRLCSSPSPCSHPLVPNEGAPRTYKSHRLGSVPHRTEGRDHQTSISHTQAWLMGDPSHLAQPHPTWK